MSQQETILKSTKIAVIGLGYVGLPLALAFAKKFEHVIGFDINKDKIARINAKIDPTNEGLESELGASTLRATSDIKDLSDANFFIVGVPTPIDDDKRPDLSPLESACKLIGSILKKDVVVVFESTVYPGITEEFCGPILEKVSNLKQGVDFKLGYSPERINPGDKEHTIDKITKVVSGEDSKTLELVAEVYSQVVTVGVYKAESIKVAEAAKVIENTQRDLNIALMNELSIIFDKMGISTNQVLNAAGTKWNFLKFTPGLVGGHCIGVDPYYLTTKAQQLGYNPQVILAGRRINDDMGKFIAQKAVKLLINKNVDFKKVKVGILGITFKENVSDIRNSRVPDIFNELKEFGIECLVHDPHGDNKETLHEYGIKLNSIEDFKEMDLVILAVPHKEYLAQKASLLGNIKKGGILIDIKSVFAKDGVGGDVVYWGL